LIREWGAVGLAHEKAEEETGKSTDEVAPMADRAGLIKECEEEGTDEDGEPEDDGLDADRNDKEEKHCFAFGVERGDGEENGTSTC